MGAGAQSRLPALRAGSALALDRRSPCMSGSASEPLSEVKHEVDEGLFGSDVF